MREILMALLLLLCAGVVSGDTLQSYLKDQTRYWGIHDTISAAEMDKLVELKEKADQPGLKIEDRTKAYEELFQFVQKIRGIPVSKVPAAMAASNWTEGEMPIPSMTNVAKPGELGNFTKRGAGKIAMILIPDIGADATVFDSFMQRNQQRYTMYAVTLAGFGGTAAPAKPARLDFGKREWWNNAETAVMNLMEKEKISQPFIVGHQAGAYLAMKIALTQPQRVRGAVVLNGLLYAPITGLQPDASAEERVKYMNSTTPVELFPNPSTAKYRGFMMQFASWNCKDKERQEKIADMAANSKPSTWWNYFAELATTDLRTEIKTVKVPMLVVPSVHDAASPGFEMSKSTLEQWKNAGQSITVINMEDSRGYATEDQPAKLDEVIHTWIFQRN